MKKYMPLEGLRWSRDSGSALCDTSQNSRSRTGWGGHCFCVLFTQELSLIRYHIAWWILVIKPQKVAELPSDLWLWICGSHTDLAESSDW